MWGGALSPCGVGEASQRVAALDMYRVLPPPLYWQVVALGRQRVLPSSLMAGAALRSKGRAPLPTPLLAGGRQYWASSCWVPSAPPKP